MTDSPKVGNSGPAAAVAVGKDATEIEITPQMIEAGLATLEDSGRLINDRVSSGDGLLVRCIFLSMWSRRRAGEIP